MNAFGNAAASSVPGHYLPFDGDGRLYFWRDACAAARSTAQACRRCEEECPAAALSVRNDGPERILACLGCGRCAAACPTGALAVRGFNQVQAANGKGALRVECWKVPAALSSGDTVRVPCLGGITLPQLLGWCAKAIERPVVFVEHGWCADCSAGGVRQPGNAVMLLAAQMLEACGRPREILPKWESGPAPFKLMPRDIPEHTAAAPLGRRAFFRRCVTEVAASVAPPEAAPAPVKSLRRRSVCPMPVRERVFALLRQIAASYGAAPPEALHPVLTISGSCRHHGVCAGMCPTGAIVPYRAPGKAGLQFDPTVCIACGLCARSCPEHAITIEARGGGPSTQRLTVHQAAVCAGCQREHVIARADGLCPACQKQRAQARSLFGTPRRAMNRAQETIDSDSSPGLDSFLKLERSLLP